ncbi:hypothetical protein [Candidatus Enterovibrio escicola]|uniref:hypothetical protein n=1 Tax=Candidatus Enterovibrio escicola TaxID=1927127 RepID=UPI00123809DC|nr:hypothetical protein [Candidatus Enterovibrio escacola]
MIKLKTIRDRYKTDYALAKEMGITGTQLKCLLDRDALFDCESGAFYVTAAAKAKVGDYKGGVK